MKRDQRPGFDPDAVRPLEGRYVDHCDVDDTPARRAEPLTEANPVAAFLWRLFFAILALVAADFVLRALFP